VHICKIQWKHNLVVICTASTWTCNKIFIRI